MAEDKPQEKEKDVEPVNPQVQMIKLIKIMLIMFVLILFGLGGMSFYFLKSMLAHSDNPQVSQTDKPNKKGAGEKEGASKEEIVKAEDKPAGTDTTKPLYYRFSPSIVTTIISKDQMRYLRVDVELVSKDNTMIENLATYAPIIRDELTNLFSTQSYEELIQPQTKDILRKKVSDSVKKIMKDNTGQDNIEQVLFTTFIIQ